MSRTLPALAFTATVLMMSCAANPNAPSPVKGDEAAAMNLLTPRTLVAVNTARAQCVAGPRRPARLWAVG